MSKQKTKKKEKSITCLNCSKKFYVTPAQAKKRKFCSRDCSIAYSKKTKEDNFLEEKKKEVAQYIKDNSQKIEEKISEKRCTEDINDRKFRPLFFYLTLLFFFVFLLYYQQELFKLKINEIESVYDSEEVFNKYGKHKKQNSEFIRYEEKLKEKEKEIRAIQEKLDDVMQKHRLIKARIDREEHIRGDIENLNGEMGEEENVNLGDINLEILNLINKERVGSGLNELVYSKLVENIAARHCDDMIHNEYVEHSNFEEFAQEELGDDYIEIGEILANNFNNSEEILDSWLESASHRDVIFYDKWNKIGISSVVQNNGTYLISVCFLRD